MSEEVKKILKMAQNHLYSRMAGAIHSYLKQNHIEYSNFRSEEIFVEYSEIMSLAGDLLHSFSCEKMIRRIGDADYYYVVMDCQHWIRNDCYEGCYYAVRRIAPADEASCRYDIIVQTFVSDVSDCRAQGHFAIRSKEGKQNFHNISAKEGEPVLPVSGCVDLTELLLNIDRIIETGGFLCHSLYK